jgi:hypothetical protein
MNLYRLLRSNKETGPHTQEDLIAMGFKPYDLIWVEGKSAGWRYPSELPEFKGIAPVIEEQPYDRFYKKPVPAAAKEAPAEMAVATRETEKTNREKVYQQPAYNNATRHIHVTLPSGNRVNLTTINNNKESVQQKPVPAYSEEKISFSESITKPYQAPVVNETVPATAYREKKAVTEEIPAQHYYPAQQTGNSFSWTMIMGLFVGIATLVGLGVMIGLSINREDRNTALNASLNTKPKQEAVITQPENTNTVPPAETNPVAGNGTQEQQTLQPEADKNLVNNAVIKKDISQHTIAKEDKPQPSSNAITPETKEPSHNLAKGETREALRRNTMVVPAANFEKQLNIKTNTYKVGAFGGISDLQCTLVNDSKFALDVVEVEVVYIQANDKVYKTETIAFKDVAAGAQITKDVPKTTRGIKVTTRITKVSPKESGLSKI